MKWLLLLTRIYIEAQTTTKRKMENEKQKNKKKTSKINSMIVLCRSTIYFE